MKLERINGVIFEAMVKGGYNNLCLHEKEINDMNIFPVPDGDTGYNMRMTLENGIKHARSNKHLGEYLNELNHGMLLGARGNSGVILSQLFHGMSVELERKSIVDAGELRDALVRAYKTAYAAVAHPVEGTILTVAREGIENVRSQVRRGTTVDMVMSMYLAEMRKSVKNTPEILKVLKDAGVLDSGAVGYITVVDGMTRAMYGEKIASDGAKNLTEKAVDVTNSFNETSVFAYGYCTEFLLQLLNAKTDAYSFNPNDFIKELSAMGNSLVVIRSGSIVKVHIHTFEPENVIRSARRYGEFISFKLENMQVQHSEFENGKAEREVALSASDDDLYTAKKIDRTAEHKPLAVVAVADGSGITEILKSCGADVVLPGGQTMNTSAEDFVAAYKSLNADKIVVLPDNGNIEQAALQAAEISGLGDKIVVIPTKSVIEGYYALAIGSPEIENTDERIAAMNDGAESILTVSVAMAVKDYVGTGLSCRKGDYLGFIGKKLVSAEKDRDTALVKTLKAVENLEDKSNFIVLKGAKISENDEENLSKSLEEEFSDISAEFLDGGQKIYDYIVGVV